MVSSLYNLWCHHYITYGVIIIYKPSSSPLVVTSICQVSGIEGNFRNTAENVMRVLRTNKESVTAMLEAFVHDPLINWRLLTTADATTAGAAAGGAGGVGGVDAAGGMPRGDSETGQWVEI